MKSIKLSFALALSLLVMGLFTSSAGAQTTVDQNQSQDLDIRCEVGSYGQTVNCYSRGRQDQSFRAVIQEREGKTVIVRDGKTIPVHTVVDTSLDFNSLMTFAGIVGTGAFATALKAKTRK